MEIEDPASMIAKALREHEEMKEPTVGRLGIAREEIGEVTDQEWEIWTQLNKERSELTNKIAICEIKGRAWWAAIKKRLSFIYDTEITLEDRKLYRYRVANQPQEVLDRIVEGAKDAKPNT